VPTAPPAFSIRAVYLDGQVLPGRELGELARLPTKEVLLAQVIGQLQSPVAVLAGLLEAPVTELARLLDAMANQLPGLLEARARQLESA
jgi:large subunit ribosomal protein L10